MTKTLTEQWKEGELELNSLWFVRLPCGLYDECFYTGSTIFMKSISGHDEKIWQVLAPVPSYQQLYGPNDGMIPVGLFTVLKLIKRDIERTQEYRNLTDLECGIKSQVVSLLKKWKV